MVPKAGIEPAWAKSPVDFESTASTCFTTSAYCELTLILLNDCQAYSVFLQDDSQRF